MLQAIQRYVILIGGMILSAFLCVRAEPFLLSARGDTGPTMLTSQSPVAAVLAFVICLGLAAVLAGVVGRFSNSVVGLFVLGTGLFALDGRTESIRNFAFARAGDSPGAGLALLAIEAALLAIMLLGATLLVFRISGPLKDIEPKEFGETPHQFWSAEAWKSAAAGAIILLAVVVIGQSSMKGQMVAAAFIGGMVAGLVGRLISPHVQPVLLFASPVLFGAIGYVIAIFFVNMPLDAAYVSGRLTGLAIVTPLDYAAGSLMGVAVGLGWAKSFLHHEEQTSPAAAAG